MDKARCEHDTPLDTSELGMYAHSDKQPVLGFERYDNNCDIDATEPLGYCE